MKHPYRLAMTLTLLVGLCTYGIAGEDNLTPLNKKRMVPYSTWTTTSGTPVYAVQISELPIIDIKIAFTAGSAFDDKYPGLAYLTGNSLFEGTAKHSGDEIAEKFDALGAQTSAQVSRDASTISLRTLSAPETAEPALAQFIEVISQPSFEDNALARNKNLMLASLKQAEQKPSELASRALFKALYDGFPYAHPVEGEKDSITTLTPDLCREFHQHYYTAKNAVIVIVGNLSTDAAKRISERIASALPRGEAVSFPALARKQSAHTEVTIPYPSVQSTLLLSQLGVKRGDPDFIPLSVGNYTLGGGSTISRLFQEVREKRGLSYHIYSSWSPMKERGPFVIGLQTKSSQAQEALNVTRETLQTFFEKGPTEKELTAAKQYLTGNFPLNFDSNGDIANNLLLLGFYHLPQDYFDRYIERVNQVTSEQVQETLHKHIIPSQLITISVGPKASS